MNTINKLLRITGSLSLSCVSLTSKVDVKAMTLQEVAKFFEGKKQEADKVVPQKLQEIRDDLPQLIEEVTKDFTAPREGDGQLKLGPRIKVENALSKFISDCFIRTVSYNEKNGSFDLEVERFCGRNGSPIGEVPFPVCEERLCAEEVKNYILGSSSLEAISQSVTEEELRKRGVTDEEMKSFGDFKIREITFQSILSSGVFDSEYKDKALELLKDKELLKGKIKEYADGITILQCVPVIIKETRLGFKIGIDQNKKDVLDVKNLGSKKWDRNLWCVSKESSVRKYIVEVLTDCLSCKTGPEKIILFLLLCEKTSLEERLQWCESSKFSYRTFENRITFPRDKSQCRSRVVLHEIGHYLEQRLGFKQTFEDYRNPFAEKLLLLENEYKRDGKVFVPELLREYFQSFLQDLSFEDKMPNDFSENDLFMYWQLYSRWRSKREISNILGICFEKNSKTIYINALSDIRGLRRVRYGHDYGLSAYNMFGFNMVFNKKSDELDRFKKEGGLDVIIKANFQRPDPEVLHLLCKLHKREFSEDYINFADAKTESDVAKIREYIGEYKSSDE